MLPLGSYTITTRALMFYYWTRGLVSDDEYRRYKLDYTTMEPIAARDNDRRALETMQKMGW